MFTEIFQKLQKLANWKIALIALGVFLLIQVFLAGYVIPNIRSRHPEAVEKGILVMVDMRPLATAEEAYQIFDLYKPDIIGYVQILYATDFLIPLAAAFFLISVIGMLLKYLDKAARWRWLLLIPCLPVPFDFTENILALFMIARHPAHVYPGLASLEGVLTAIKQLGYRLAMITTVVVVLVALAKFIYTKMRPRAA